MSETFLNQFTFRIGWKKKESIELFDTEHDIIIKLKAYYEKEDRKSTRLNSSHRSQSRMPSSA